jgi:hypothetical protein
VPSAKRKTYFCFGAGALGIAAIFYSSPATANALDACPSAYGALAAHEKEGAELLEWPAQVALRRDRDQFDSLDSLGYSYSNATDASAYQKLAAQQNARLSGEEKETLAKYSQMSGSFHEQLNKDLARLKFSEKNDPAELQRQLASLKIPNARKKQIQLLLSAFDKGMLLPKGLILFRGIGPGSSLAFGAAGSTVRWNRLTSSSMDPETARYFLNEGRGDRSFLLVIEVEKPVKALLSENPKEMEFVLPPGTRFEVVRKKFLQADNVSIVRLKTAP